MQVILLERVENLGQMGDEVTVKPGYARNFLLPKRMALRATEANRKRFEQERSQLEATNLERKTEADGIAGKLEGLTVILIRAASDSGQLYGSVNARDIANAVTEAGFSVHKGQVLLDRPVKTLGVFELRIRLHPEVSVAISVNVAQSEEEAAAQADRVARGLPAVQTLAEQEAEQSVQRPERRAASEQAAAPEAEADATEAESATDEEPKAETEAGSEEKPTEH